MTAETAKKLTCKNSDGAQLNSFENASWRDLLETQTLMEVKVVLHCGNPNSAGNKGGAPVGNTNSSSREKNISNLFEEGCAFDRHSDDTIALFSLGNRSSMNLCMLIRITALAGCWPISCSRVIS